MTIILLAFLTTLWVFAAVCVIGLISYFGRELDPTSRLGSSTVDLIIGLAFVAILSIAPLAIIIILRVN